MTILQIAGEITGVAAAAAVFWQVFRWGRNIAEGQRCLLRSEMTKTYYRHQEDKTLRQYEFEAFMDNYAAYKALGGNSFIEKCKAEITEGWEVRS